ncbi:protein APCDD1-like [Mercenaria mercenaria]|uniref:protein APCDD1-like n=1 Tax=Mercenaria mercenaria TaxID=6596 RepID=UPI00234EA4CB|nr:protein APCDD1-like [Mercenaria mercenaria]
MKANFLIIGSLLLTLTLKCTEGQGETFPKWAEDDCRRMLREATEVSVKSPSPPKLSGHWTSSSCEIRPGPEFVLRKYLFRRNSFQAQLYYYADEHCKRATHFISAKGSVKISRPSWRTPGAHETRYTLSDISVIPYTQEKAELFGKLMVRYCKRSEVTYVLPYKKFPIFQFTKYSKNNDKNDFIESDFDCAKIFNFTMNELQLVRMEKRKLKSARYGDVSRKTRARSELFLGDISTNMKYRRQYVPTHYQTPLVKSKTQGCNVCRVIANATHMSPPVLDDQGTIEVGLYGEWVSQRCETRPNGQYLTRYLSFLKNRKSWQGVYEFYKDPLCSEATFKIEVKGTYVKGRRSDKIHSANNYLFKTSRLKVTALDFHTVSYLNSYYGDGCGNPGTWKLGVTQDVTDTKGCVTFGISLPNIEYELMKTEYEGRKSFLFVGQRPSDFVSMASPKNRPTSFQGALVKCGAKNDVSNELKPVYKQYSGHSADDGEIQASTGTVLKPSALIIAFIYTFCQILNHKLV